MMDNRACPRTARSKRSSLRWSGPRCRRRSSARSACSARSSGSGECEQTATKPHTTSGPAVHLVLNRSFDARSRADPLQHFRCLEVCDPQVDIAGLEQGGVHRASLPRAGARASPALPEFRSARAAVSLEVPRVGHPLPRQPDHVDLPRDYGQARQADHRSPMTPEVPSPPRGWWLPGPKVKASCVERGVPLAYLRLRPLARDDAMESDHSDEVLPR